MAGKQTYMAPKPYHETGVSGGRTIAGAAADPSEGERTQMYAPMRPYWQDPTRLSGQAEGTSDRERAERIQAALQERFGGPERLVSVRDVFMEDSTVVWWLESPTGVEPAGSELFQSEFTEENSVVAIEGEPVRVVRRTIYERQPVGNRRVARTAYVRVGGGRGTGPVVGLTDGLQERAKELLAAMSHADRAAVTTYVIADLRRAGAC